MKIKKLFKTLSLSLLIGVISCSALTGCSFNSAKEQGGKLPVDTMGQVDASQVEIETVSSPKIKLFSSEPETVANDFVYRWVEASVDSATSLTNDSVTWEIVWQDSQCRDEISEYVELKTYEPNRHNKVELCFLKEFSGKPMTLICTTNVGGFKATCNIKYVGMPNAMTVNTDGEVLYDAYNDVNYYNCKVGYNGIGALCSLKTPLDLITYEFIPNYEINVEAFGSAKYKSSVGLTITSTIVVDNTIVDEGNGELDPDIQPSESLLGGTVYLVLENAFGMQVAKVPLFNYIALKENNDELVINIFAARKAPEQITYFDSGEVLYGSGKFVSYTDEKPIYYTLTITEKTSGVVGSINIRTTCDINGVSLDQNEIII